MPTERELLIGFYDLGGYMRYAERPSRRDCSTMAGYFALTGQIVQDAGGRLIKTLGDAGLVAFPAEAADAGVLALAVRAIDGSRVARPAWLDGYRRQAAPGTRRDRPGRQPGRGDHRRLRQDGERRRRLARAGLTITPAVFRSLQPRPASSSRSTRRRSSATSIWLTRIPINAGGGQTARRHPNSPSASSSPACNARAPSLVLRTELSTNE